VLIAIFFELLWAVLVKRRGALHDGIATLIYALAGFWGGVIASAGFGVLLGFITGAVSSTAGLIIWARTGGSPNQATPAPVVVVGAITLWGGLVGWVAGLAGSLTPWSAHRR
jgi:hypothetical protein